MSTDWSRSNGTFLELLKTAPLSIRSSSSSITKRVKYQLTNPPMAASRTAAATTTNRIRGPAGSAAEFGSPLARSSRPK